MRTILTNLFSSAVSSLKQFEIKQLAVVVLAGLVLMTSHAAPAASTPTTDSETLGKAIRERIEETDQSNRPKTTGEFLEEARGDIPLDERLGNITRDSVEAFKELGREYTPDLSQGAENLRDGLARPE